MTTLSSAVDRVNELLLLCVFSYLVPLAVGMCSKERTHQILLRIEYLCQPLPQSYVEALSPDNTVFGGGDLGGN